MDGDQTGGFSLVESYHYLKNTTIDNIWGVVDLTIDSNFPDVRNSVAIQSTSGSSMLIPRENDKTRLYIQLLDEDMVDPTTGRVDKSHVNPQKIIEVSAMLVLRHRYRFMECWS